MSLRSEYDIWHERLFNADPIELPFLESSRVVRGLLSPIALHYFLLSEKRGRG